MKPTTAPAEMQAAEKNMPKTKTNGKKWLKKIGVTSAALVVVAGAGYGGYWWRDRDAKKEIKTQKDQVASLQSQLDSQKSSASSSSSSSASSSSSSSSSATTVKTPTTAELDNIKAAITSGNTAALDGYMASSVSVIVAASEGIGTRTPTQAISDLDYLNMSPSVTWDFSLSSSTLSSYRAGFYKDYFPTSAVVGKSSENKVVSFSFDDNAKIKTIFMAASDDLLM